MFNQLVALGWGLVTFAIVIGIGTVVLEKFGGAVANCPTGYSYQTNGTATYTTGLCCLDTGTTCSTAGNYTAPATATTSAHYLEGQLGSSSGLASWVPAIIALAVGLLFLGSFMVKKGNKSY